MIKTFEYEIQKQSKAEKQNKEKQKAKQRLQYCTVRAKKQRRRRRRQNEDEQSSRQISATYAISLLFVFNFCYLFSPPLSFFSLSARRKREKQQQDTPRLLCTFSIHTHTQVIHSFTQCRRNGVSGDKAHLAGYSLLQLATYVRFVSFIYNCNLQRAKETVGERTHLPGILHCSWQRTSRVRDQQLILREFFSAIGNIFATAVRRARERLISGFFAAVGNTRVFCFFYLQQQCAVKRERERAAHLFGDSFLQLATHAFVLFYFQLQFTERKSGMENSKK